MTDTSVRLTSAQRLNRLVAFRASNKARARELYNDGAQAWHRHHHRGSPLPVCPHPLDSNEEILWTAGADREARENGVA